MSLSDDEASRLLHTRLQELKREEELAGESTAPVTLEQDAVGRLSRIDALQLQAMALASQRRRDGEKNRIETALRRLREGEYGYCLTCGEEIGEARLRHNPAAARCVGCAD
jgi:DnaK suppressor protein